MDVPVPGTGEMDKLDIEIQFFEGCPNSMELIDRVRKALEKLGIAYSYRETLVESYEFAKRISFRGSPTLLINGIDFENAEPPDNPGMNCRVYQGHLPTEKELVEKFKSVT